MNHRSVIVICFHNALKHMLYTVQSNLFIAANFVLALFLNLFFSLDCPSDCAYCEFVASSKTTKCSLRGCDSGKYQVTSSMECKGLLCPKSQWVVYMLSNFCVKE